MCWISAEKKVQNVDYYVKCYDIDFKDFFMKEFIYCTYYYSLDIKFFVCFLLFRAALVAYGCSQARDPIRATVAGLHHSLSNARSLTHWTRPGIEPTTSWFLVRSIYTMSPWELLIFFYDIRFCSGKDYDVVNKMS